MPTDYLVTDTELTSVANAIRSRGNTSSSLQFPTDFVSAISELPSARLIDYQKVYFDTTATNANPKYIYMPSGYTKYSMFFCIDTNPVAPDPAEYIALAGYRLFVTQGSSVTGFILRPAGTIGTDGSMINYNPTDGLVTFGGAYGHFMAGTSYHIYLFEIG